MSIRLRLLNVLLRHVTKPQLARVTDPGQLRAQMEGFAALILRPAPFCLALPLVLAGREALAIRSGPAKPGAVIVHFHGGAFVAGSPRTHMPMLSRLARLAHVEVIAPSYRLAPEHPFPAALQDAEAVWDALLARGYRAENMVLSGDSAGAGLAFALLAKLCARGEPPAGVLAFSPWLDLTGSAPSVVENAGRDPMLVASRTAEVAQYYLQGHPAEDPFASPLFADFPHCPPVRLQCSDPDILRDDALRMEEKLRREGVDVLVQLWPEAPHAWHLFDGLIPEAREALRDAARAAQAMLTAPPQR